MLVDCKKNRNEVEALHLHLLLCAYGLETHVLFCNYLIPLLVEVGSIRQAQYLFDKSPCRDERTWNCLIAAYSKYGDLEYAFKLHHAMHQDNSVQLSSFATVSLLKACTRSKDLEIGSNIHANIKGMNLENDIFVASALIDMYTKCGLFHKANEVFDNLSNRDVVTWTSLLMGYVDNGRGEETLQLFERMQLECILPDAITFVCNLRACATVGTINKGREVHAKAYNKGLVEKDAFLANALIGMYVKVGLLAQAHQMFDRFLVRNVISWTTLITGYVENKQSEEALQCLEQMQLEGTLFDTITVVSSLKACAGSGKVQKGQEIHARFIDDRLLDSDIVLANALIDMYAKCGLLTNARQVFDRLSNHDVVSWTSLITGNVELGFSTEALQCWDQMQMEGVIPNAPTFTCLLKACGSLKDSERGQRIHMEAEKRGLLSSEYLCTALVDMYAKCGLLATAEQVFNSLTIRDVVAWTSLISAFAEHGHCEQAFRFFKQMLSKGHNPTEATFICTLKACEAIESVVEIHGEIERRGLLEADIVLRTTLVSIYAKCGSLVRAQEVFDKFHAHDIVSWNSIMTAYADYGYYMEALQCYELMCADAVFPDALTFICILKVCQSAGRVQKVARVHGEIEKWGFLERELDVGITLIDVYAKFGLLAKAQIVFEKLSFRNIRVWNSLFAGYVENGRTEKARFCLTQMELEGVSPNLETLLHSLKVCGNVEDDDTRNNVTNFDVEWRDFYCKDSNNNTTASECIEKDMICLSHEVFNKLVVQDLTSWSALLAGYLACGLYNETLKCFEQMQLKGIAPNAAILVHSLRACGSIEILGKGQEIHAEVERKGLLGSDQIIGNSVIDMYAKCGYLHLARQVLDNLSVRDVISWTSLITGLTECWQWEEALNCMEQMQLEGIAPDAVAYACSLKICGVLGAVVRGEELHCEVERQGLLERNLLVGSALVAMYSHCGMLSRAHEVLNQLPTQGIVTWTILMMGYLEGGFFEETISCFEGLQICGIAADNVAYVCALKACTEIGDLEKGMELHTDLEFMGLMNGDSILDTTLIDMYAKCGALSTAQQVFDRLANRDEISWTALVSGYTEEGDYEGALNCLEKMKLEGFPVNSVAFMLALRSCGSMGEKHCGEQFHIEIQKKGLLEMDHIAKALVDMYAKCGLFDMAMDLLDKLQVRDRFLWTSLIGGFAQFGHGEEALAAFDQMLLEGKIPDAAAFVCSLKACTSIGLIRRGRELHGEIERVGLLQDVAVGTSLVDMYVKCGMLVEAQEVFNKLPRQDVVCWTALIVGYTHYGHGEEALEYFEQMQNEGIFADQVSLICILKACSIIGATRMAQEIHLDIEKRGLFERSPTVGNMLINMYAKSGLFALATQVFQNLPSPDIVSWNSLISGYARFGESNTFFQNLEKMLQGDVSPDPVTFKIIYSACNRMGLFQMSQEYFSAMSNDYKIIPTLEHLVSMVDLLCREGHVNKAIGMIKRMPESPNLVLWNRVIEACKNCGRLELGKQAFDFAVMKKPMSTSQK
ncbi:hypothetical protein KP509_39G043600 [Ceratopteris richardii]|uniref:Pentatricopeptide repeat-containing protein n=1 Tax=Ceratopteris richardii TaxID=49495 RepID=A0A8T2Q034_CERRI|nr:hypothetical protein KP509_39G043600 [Ceratopteris richardii]